MNAATARVTLRAPQATDREQVDRLVAATGVFRPDERAIALEVFDSAVDRPGVDYTSLGAYDDAGILTGFACYGHTPCTTHTWDLYWIAVDPSVHRQGTGRMLMRACEHDMTVKGGRLIVVETSSRPDYGPTRAFYEALGYGVAARIPDYYAPNDDLVTYVKRLDSSRSTLRHG
ncbi:MAG TPA: N-acetyltransferase [Gemmatimonadales bacterium]|nr:N-acetyltransferase [Gemmatimonadales bacterium]